MAYPKRPGVYKITSPSGKVYVGMTISIPKRENSYKNYHCEAQPRLYSSLKKYGWENHIFEVLEECDEALLTEREVYWGTKFEVLGEKGLNCSIGERSSLQLRPEVGKKISESKKGMTCTWGHKIGKANQGKKRTAEHIEVWHEASRVAKLKKVICINTGELFESVQAAAKHFKTKPNNISNVLQGWSKSTCGGLKFKILSN